VTMISHGVEISIARGGGKIVHGYLSGLFFFFCYPVLFVLGTKSLMQR